MVESIVEKVNTLSGVDQVNSMFRVLVDMDTEVLSSIHGFGKSRMEALVEAKSALFYWDSVIQLLSWDVRFSGIVVEDNHVGSSGVFDGLKICVTGKFVGLSRSEIEKIVSDFGGKNCEQCQQKH